MFTEVQKEQSYLEKLNLQRNSIFCVKTVEAKSAKNNPCIFINNLFLCLNKAQPHNFADNNTISAETINVNELIKTLKEESEIVTD